MEYFWTIRLNRLVLQFEGEEASLKWKRPKGIPGQIFYFLSPRLKNVDMLSLDEVLKSSIV